MTDTPTPQIPHDPSKDYWQNVKDFGIAAISAATGDPEAIKTIVDILANATYLGLEHLDLKDTEKNEIKKKLEDGVNTGADGIMDALTKFQIAAKESNGNIRKKLGRNRSKPSDTTPPPAQV